MELAAGGTINLLESLIKGLKTPEGFCLRRAGTAGSGMNTQRGSMLAPGEG